MAYITTHIRHMLAAARDSARETRQNPAAGLIALGVITGSALTLLLVCPLLVAEVRHDLNAAWAEDVQAREAHSQAMYERGRSDELEMAALARECEAGK